ncbi:MAG: hypothetical protein ACRENE_13055, partial [Polyangiaceae bacterium]
MLLRRARHLSLLPLLGAVGAAGSSVACSHSAGPNDPGGVTTVNTTALATQNESVVSSTSGQAPATPFAESGGVLRSVNVVRSVAISGDSVVGRWGEHFGPETRTARVNLGSSAVAFPTKWALEGAAAVRTAGGVTERIAPTAVGYQRSWTFAAAPAQSGTIVASVAATADAVLSMDASGLHVVRGGTGFRIGSATWIDAGGARTTIAPSYEHGQLVYEVPADLVGRSAFPAVLDPDVGPEFLVPPTQNINPWMYTNDPTVSATSIFPLDNGGVGIVVTGSNTGGNAAPYWGSGQLIDLYAPSASAASGLTLQTSRAFSGAPTGQPSGSGCGGPSCPIPAVASSPCGTDECIAWAYLTSAGTVYMQRFDTTTWQWYDTSAVTISNSLNDSPKLNTEPQLVANGTQYLVCWLDTIANNVHCSTRAAGSLNAVGSTVAVAGPAAVTSFSSAATSGAFGVLVPGTVASDGGLTANATVTVITSSTGAATGSAVGVPAALGASPTLTGESGGNFLVGSPGTTAPVPGLLAGVRGNPPSTITDASLTGYSSGLVQRVTSAGALSGSPFSPGGGFSV